MCGCSYFYSCYETNKTNEHKCYMQPKQQKGGKCKSECICNREKYLEQFVKTYQNKVLKMSKIKVLETQKNKGKFSEKNNQKF